MSEFAQRASTVVLRTVSALFEGKLQASSRLRLPGYMNGPSHTVDLADATVKDGPRSKVRDIGCVSIPKGAVLYVFLREEDERAGPSSRYEREAMEGRLSDEPYLLRLGPGVDVSGRIFGGSHSVVRPRASFTGLEEAVIHDKILGPKARKPGTIMVNVERAECCYEVGQTD